MDIQPGQQWRHYKDKLYEIVGVAIHSETTEEIVVYRQLYSVPEYPEGTLWVRPKDMFLEMVTLEDGREVQRFTLVE